MRKLLLTLILALGLHGCAGLGHVPAAQRGGLVFVGGSTVLTLTPHIANIRHTQIRTALAVASTASAVMGMGLLLYHTYKCDTYVYEEDYGAVWLTPQREASDLFLCTWN